MVEGGRSRSRIPVGVQIGVVAVLFLAALGTLVYTGLAVLGRERRRGDVERTLRRADAALDQEARDALASVRPWPEMSEPEWAELDRRLAHRAAGALGRFEGVEGGYFSREGHRFLGTVGPASKGAAPPRPGHGPPPREFDLIETQADAAVRKWHAA